MPRTTKGGRGGNTRAMLEAMKRLEQRYAIRRGVASQYAEQLAAEKARLQGRLRAYVEGAWPLIEPHTPFVGGYHIDAMCEHLEAVTRGQIKDLLINVPPRHSKSTVVSVMWMTWGWIDAPWLRWLYTSYAEGLAMRDQGRCKRVMESWWYQQRWGDKFLLFSKGNRLDNDATGHRLAMGVGGSITGEGGDVLVCDDPHNIKEAYSVTKREGVLTWWDQVMAGRRNDPRTSARVIIMQRVHQGDLSGHVLRQGSYVHVKLPTEYEPPLYVPGVTLPPPSNPIGWQDPRTEPGELLHPERFDKPAVAQIKRELRGYGFAAQHQQRPAPAEGGIVKLRWWQYWRPRDRPMAPVLLRTDEGGFEAREARPLPDAFAEVAQSWDMAFTDTEGSSYVVGGVWGRRGADRYLLDQVRAHLDLVHTISAIVALSRKWPQARARVIENKANGPAVIALLRRKLGGLIEFNPNEYGPKIARVYAVSPSMEGGNVWVPHPELYPWVQEFLDEWGLFPMGEDDDQVDQTTQMLLHWEAKAIAAGASGVAGTSYWLGESDDEEEDDDG